MMRKKVHRSADSAEATRLFQKKLDATGGQQSQGSGDRISCPMFIQVRLFLCNTACTAIVFLLETSEMNSDQPSENIR